MGISWSGMCKVLEQDNICESLKGRIQYFATRYRESHDQEGLVAIRLDDEEVFQSCFFEWNNKQDEVIKDNPQLKKKSNFILELLGRNPSQNKKELTDNQNQLALFI